MSPGGAYAAAWGDDQYDGTTQTDTIQFAVSTRRALRSAVAGDRRTDREARGPEDRIASDGHYVAVYNYRSSSLGSDDHIRAQLLAADGTPIGTEFLVSPETSGTDQLYDVAVAPDGGSSSLEHQYEITTRGFAADGRR